jgi:hypothetical protein
MPESTKLQVSDLYHHCTPEQWTFSSTADLKATNEVIGQQRALNAIEFGSHIDADGYNLFVMGPAGVGKYTLTRRYLEQHVEHLPTAKDWAYLNNFSDSQRPYAVSLPAGQGKQLR